jgi:hypothetical protein
MSGVDLEALITDLSFGEQPRWHDGRLWLSDWGFDRLGDE